MPVLLPRHPCPACGSAHDLCDAGRRAYVHTGVYVYTCPTTQQHVSFRPFVPGTVVGDRPAGAVAMMRVDSTPDRDP